MGRLKATTLFLDRVEDYINEAEVKGRTNGVHFKELMREIPDARIDRLEDTLRYLLSHNHIFKNSDNRYFTKDYKSTRRLKIAESRRNAMTKEDTTKYCPLCAKVVDTSYADKDGWVRCSNCGDMVIPETEVQLKDNQLLLHNDTTKTEVIPQSINTS